ncbi:hypothetical protein S40288_10479 [Stachybotrys chartarum IBT 40288]|nr:hypothetical protein S40288_10479 [Stachybotrys chartarum IBT 40288]
MSPPGAAVQWSTPVDLAKGALQVRPCSQENNLGSGAAENKPITTTPVPVPPCNVGLAQLGFRWHKARPGSKYLMSALPTTTTAVTTSFKSWATASIRQHTAGVLLSLLQALTHLRLRSSLRDPRLSRWHVPSCSFSG